MNEYYSYPNGDYSYADKYGYYCLIRDGKDLLKGKTATDCWSYDNGDYEYTEEFLGCSYKYNVKGVEIK